LFGIFLIGGEEDIEGRAVAYLLVRLPDAPKESFTVRPVFFV